MTKIFFPYNDQPKRFSFKFLDPIRFSFHIDNFVYYWNVETDGLPLYLLNNQISPDLPIVKDILLDKINSDLCLFNEPSDTLKHILIELPKEDLHGLDENTLQSLDLLPIYDMDSLIFGNATTFYTNRIDLETDLRQFDITKFVEASNITIQLSNLNHITIGDLDPCALGDIDSILSAFHVFRDIPARLVKEVRIDQNNMLDVGVSCAIKKSDANALGMDCYISAVEQLKSLANLTLDPIEHYKQYLVNGTVPLEVEANN